MEEAIQHTEERLQQALKSGDLYAQKELRVQLGQLQFDSYQYHRCLNTLDQAMILVRQFRDDTTEASLHRTQAAAYRALGRYSDALAEHRTLLGMARSSTVRASGSKTSSSPLLANSIPTNTHTHIHTHTHTGMGVGSNTRVMQASIYIDMAAAYRDRAEHRQRRAVCGTSDVRRGRRCIRRGRDLLARERSPGTSEGWIDDVEAAADYTEAALYLVPHIMDHPHRAVVRHREPESHASAAGTISPSQQQNQQQQQQQLYQSPSRHHGSTEEDMKHAERLLLKAIIRHRKTGSESALAKDYRALADVAMARDKDKTAVGCLRSALEQAVNAGDAFESAAADEAMGHLYFRRHHFDRAQHHFQRAQRRIPEACQRIQQRLAANASSARHAGACLQRARRGETRCRQVRGGGGGRTGVREVRRLITDAEHMGHAGYLEQAARALVGWGEMRGDGLVAAEGQEYLADAWEMKGRPSEAETARRRALGIRRGMKEKGRGLGRTLVGLSNVLVERYETEGLTEGSLLEEAEQLLKEAQGIAMTEGELRDELTVLKSLSYVYTVWGRKDAAQETERRIREVYDDIKGGPTFESVVDDPDEDEDEDEAGVYGTDTDNNTDNHAELPDVMVVGSKRAAPLHAYGMSDTRRPSQGNNTKRRRIY